MYADHQPCRSCGAEVRLRARDGVRPRSGRHPDGTVDERVCTNPDCPTRDGGPESPTA